MIKTIGLRLGLLTLSLLFQNTSSAAVPPTKSRIVVFADKKTGEFKADKTIRTDTTESLENLKLVQTDQKNVHACFVGSSADIKPILNTMISNTNKDLTLKSFSTQGTQSPIHIEVMSDQGKAPYLTLNIDPC
jgi:hypothetical protein